MRIGEFIKSTNLGRKTAIWLYDNVFGSGDRENETHRRFTDEDVQWVLIRQPENFEDAFYCYIKQIDDTNYYVSSDGRVWNYSRGFLEEMAYEINSGYKRVRLVKNGVGKHYKVSRLVAIAFVPNTYDKPIVNHLDGNKLNDDYTNLEWATFSENTKHAYDTGLAKNASGSDDSQSKPVAMYDNDGSLITVFGSIREAVRETEYTLGYISHQARRCVKHGTQGVYFNFI